MGRGAIIHQPGLGNLRGGDLSSQKNPLPLRVRDSPRRKKPEKMAEAMTVIIRDLVSQRPAMVDHMQAVVNAWAAALVALIAVACVLQLLGKRRCARSSKTRYAGRRRHRII